MRECRKCGEKIPYTVKIEGKVRNLKNRKFCLKCSPFRSHNTSPFDPIERKRSSYSNWSDRKKATHKLSLYHRALTRKTKLIAMLGGKCKECGYNDCMGAMTFHHRERQEKLFGLTLNNLWSKTWEEIEREARKCDLLCCRCHAEFEYDLNGIQEKVNERYGTDF